MASSGRGFRIFITLLLVGIFLELFAILGALTGEDLDKGNIGVVEIVGEIDNPKPTLDLIRKFSDKEDLKAVVVRVDSPGGAVGSSQEIYDALNNLKKKKKVVASMGNLAASGGYYVSISADKIVADPGTITGSIGVIAHFFVVEDLLKKAHIKWEVIKAGEVKDMGSPLRSLTAKERSLMQGMTDDIHQQFIEAVSTSRKMPMEKVKALADGRVFSGRQAKELGLVDELGGFEKALDVAAKLAGIKEKPKPIYQGKESFSWLKKLADGKFEAPSFKMEYRFVP